LGGMLSSLTETTLGDSGDCALENSGIQRVAIRSPLIRSLVLMALNPIVVLASDLNYLTQYSCTLNKVVIIL
jgi:hypothetical protein